ncbi:hypothetical protein NDU88_001085 [Pleurodeles waltl]|uniref:Uncharacterized protein n=1 Tax=Pleurodeles waltl TaxID=8319 RepID=A0AAV7RBT5_PLEWA|nr:hypothetical protein NDU88_001085 [Pleurodeles waltl]
MSEGLQCGCLWNLSSCSPCSQLCRLKLLSEVAILKVSSLALGSRAEKHSRPSALMTSGFRLQYRKKVSNSEKDLA